MMIADAVDGSVIEIQDAVNAVAGEIHGELTIKFCDKEGSCRYQARLSALIGWRHDDAGVTRRSFKESQ